MRSPKPTLEEAELLVQRTFAEIARKFGEEAACKLFKKYATPTRLRHRRDTDLLWRFYRMENPQKLTLAKQIDPKNPQKILAQLKRALKDKRYAHFRKWAAVTGWKSANWGDGFDWWRGYFDARFPGRR
jgi:rubrerythrin